MTASVCHLDQLATSLNVRIKKLFGIVLAPLIIEEKSFKKKFSPISSQTKKFRITID